MHYYLNFLTNYINPSSLYLKNKLLDYSELFNPLKPLVIFLKLEKYFKALVKNNIYKLKNIILIHIIPDEIQLKIT